MERFHAVPAEMTDERDSGLPRPPDRAAGGPDRMAGARIKRRRWIRVGLLVVGTLVLLFFGGGGWYFSSEIESDALTVDADDSPELEFEVASIGPESLSFVLDADPDDDLVSDEILGVAWPSGYGQVGPVVERTPQRITRAYTHLTGEPGQAGDLVGLEGYAYPADPGGALGIFVERVVYSSTLGDFDAWLVPGVDDTWVIFVHGRGAHPREALRVMPVVVAAGHPALAIFYRNDVGQPAAPDGLARFGSTEWQELEGAVQFAVDQGADEVVIYGFSMGGGIAISFMLRSDLAQEVSGLILDAPALKLGAMVDSRAADTDLPLLPVAVPAPLTAVAKWIADLRFDLDWDELDYLDRADELDVPILLIHGGNDDSVPVELSDRLAEILPDLVTYERFEQAGHVRSWNVDPDRYRRAVAQFLDRVG